MRKSQIMGVLLIIMLLILGACSPAPTTTTPTTTLTSTTSALEDLAYVRAHGQNYTDDADPEWEGVEVFVLYFDKKSKQMSFTGVPVQITVELYAYPIEPGQNLPADNAEKVLVYNGKFARDHTEETIGGTMMVIRIPFEDIDINPNDWWDWAFHEVTVETPEHGIFSAETQGPAKLRP